MNEFEEHARSAAADAHESVTRLAVPELGGSPLGGGRRLVLAGAAALVLVIAGFVAFRGGEPSTIDAVADPTAPDRDGATSLSDEPAHFTFPFDSDAQVFAMDTDPDVSVGPSRFDLFGIADGDDPIAGGFLVVASSNDAQFGGIDGDPIQVRGAEGVATSAMTLSSQGIEWAEPDGTAVQLASDVLGVDELVALAETLVIDGIDVTIPEPPADMTPILEAASQAELLAATTGWTLSVADDGALFASLTGARGTDDALVLLRVVYGAMEPVEVRGTVGYRASSADAGEILVWAENGTLLSLFTPAGVDPVPLAEQVTPVSEDEWQQLVERSDGSEPGDRPHADDTDDPPFSEEILDSGTADITGEIHEWQLVLADRAEVCMFATAPDGTGEGDCIDLAADPPSWTSSAAPGRLGYIVGVASPVVDSVVVQTDLRELQILAYQVADGRVVFGTAYPGGEAVVDVFFLDEDGTVVDREPEIADDPTVEPAPVEYPRIGPLPEGRLSSGTLSGVDWALSTDVAGWLCLEELDAGRNCLPYDVVTLPLADGERHLIGGILPACTETFDVIGITGGASEIVPLDSGLQAFVIVADTPAATVVAQGVGTARLGTAGYGLWWDTDEVCTGSL